MSLHSDLWKVVDWFFPPTCVNCGQKGSLICPECLEELEKVRMPYCRKCGKPLGDTYSCGLCEKTKFHFKMARAPFIYGGGIAEAIKKLKYRQNLEIANIFGDLLTPLYRKTGWRCDMLIAVPLSAERRRERGFNQSEWIAKALSTQVGIPAIPNALNKIRNTETQVGLSDAERQQNLHQAFLAEPLLVRGKSVCLIDDVMTTGSTFNECTLALLQAGAKAVFCLSVATTRTRHSDNVKNGGIPNGSADKK